MPPPRRHLLATALFAAAVLVAGASSAQPAPERGSLSARSYTDARLPLALTLNLLGGIAEPARLRSLIVAVLGDRGIAVADDARPTLTVDAATEVVGVDRPGFTLQGRIAEGGTESLRLGYNVPLGAGGGTAAPGRRIRFDAVLFDADGETVLWRGSAMAQVRSGDPAAVDSALVVALAEAVGRDVEAEAVAIR